MSCFWCGQDFLPDLDTISSVQVQLLIDDFNFVAANCSCNFEDWSNEFWPLLLSSRNTCMAAVFSVRSVGFHGNYWLFFCPSNLFFLADFLLRWYAAESRIKFLLNSYVVGKIAYVSMPSGSDLWTETSSPAVDIVTILPTFITFIIQIIGDTYPLPPGQVDFVKALQVQSRTLI